MHIEYFNNYSSQHEFPFNNVFYYLGSDHSDMMHDKDADKLVGKSSDRTKSYYNCVTIFELQLDKNPDDISKLKLMAIMNFLREMSW